MSPQDLKTIQGYVRSLPREPERENDARVALITEDGREYRILHRGPGAELEDNVNAHVEVTGRVQALAADATGDQGGGDQGDGAGCSLSVISYRLTDGFDDPWYDDGVE